MGLFRTQTVCIILMLTFVISCSTRSKFSSESVSIGMTKEQVISKFGKPNKSSFKENKETGQTEESLFYKENFNMGNQSRTNILTFKNGKLISLEQGQESETRPTTIIAH